MNLYKLNLQEVLARFEKEMFSKDREYSIADGMEFELFSRDSNNIYALQFDRHAKNYSIIMESFDGKSDYYIGTSHLETYPMDFYNREFLISKLLKYMEHAMHKSILVKRLISHDLHVFGGKEEKLVEFAEAEGYTSIQSYYDSLDSEILREIAIDYFGIDF